MVSFLMNTSMIAFILFAVLLVHSFIKQNDKKVRYGILTGASLFVFGLGNTASEGFNSVIEFVFVAGFLVSLGLLLHAALTKNGLAKRYGILTVTFFLIVGFIGSLEGGANEIILFIGVAGFLITAIFIGLIIHSIFKKTGKTKQYFVLAIIPFIIFMISFAIGDPEKSLLEINKQEKTEETTNTNQDNNEVNNEEIEKAEIDKENDQEDQTALKLEEEKKEDAKQAEEKKQAEKDKKVEEKKAQEKLETEKAEKQVVKDIEEKEEKEKIEKEKQEQEEQAKVELEKKETEAAELKKKEAVEKADREKAEEEAKVIAKEKKEKEQAGKLGELKVHYINVGQADATLLQATENGKTTTIMIDAGDWNKTDAIDYIRSMGVMDIDVLVGTHPHADHIGQMDKIMNEMNVKEVWMSGDSASSQVFQRVLTAIDTSGADYVEPRTGEVYDIGNLKINILSPSSVNGNANESSISMKITYGEVTFVFTGDAETKSEQAMVNSGQNLKADILHLGHHGSDTSTIPAFFNAVNPNLAIYSAGNNGYGHPSASVVDRVNSADISLLGTDVHGTVIVTTDGKTYTYSSQNKGTVVAGAKKAEAKPQAKPQAQAQAKPKSKPEVTEPVVAVESTPTPEVEAPPVVEAKPDVPAGCVDINSANWEQLQEIIHIGPERADLIIDSRPFSSVENLTKVKGIAAGRLADILAQGKACAR